MRKYSIYFDKYTLAQRNPENIFSFLWMILSRQKMNDESCEIYWERLNFEDSWNRKKDFFFKIIVSTSLKMLHIIFYSFFHKLFHFWFMQSKSQPSFCSRQIHSSFTLVKFNGRFVPIQNGKIASGTLHLQTRLNTRLPELLADPLINSV